MSMSELQKKMKEMMAQVQTSATSNQGNNDYFKLHTDEQGNGSSIIRFIPQPDLTSQPYIEKWSYYFSNPVTGKIYNELSARTFGEKDVLGQFNSWLYNQGAEDRYRQQKAKRRFFSNIYVIKHPGKSDDEGQVKVFGFGVKIFDKIKNILFPDESLGDRPVNPFDVINGVNLRLKTKKVGGYANYDDSIFDMTPTPLADTEAEIMSIIESGHELNTLIDKSKLKDTETEIKALDSVFGPADDLWNEFKKQAGYDVFDTHVEAKPIKESTPEPVKPKKQTKPVDDIDIDDIINSLG